MSAEILRRAMCECGNDGPLRRGMCERCYRRWLRHQPGPLRVARTPAERFWLKVDKSDECWQWTGRINNQGYGVFSVSVPKARHIYAHRFSWELHNAPIPDGLTIDHLCGNPPCVNPDHLEPVTQGENNRRSRAARFGGDRCGRGHDYTPENTYHRPDTGKRMCRECIRYRRRETSRKRKEAS